MIELEQILVGTQANDKSGDPLTTAFQKVNANLTTIKETLDAGADESIYDVPANVTLFVRNLDDIILPGEHGGIHALGGVEIEKNLYVHNSIFIGVGSNTSELTEPVFIARRDGVQFVQGAIINTSAFGSADYAAYADTALENQGFSDMGFTGSQFNDPNYTITGPGDGYFFVQGLDDGTSHGEMHLATGQYGLTKDIVFSTGGFLAENEKMRYIHADEKLVINNDLQVDNVATINTLAFPDGTQQTTAYTGESAISKYVAVNVDGVISGSEDGITWNEYTSNLNGINRVAVGPNKIVYIADSSNGQGNDESLWYADTYDTEPTEVTALTTRDFREVKYFKSISKFIAVGNDGDGAPALHYSDDGITWTESTVDPTFLETIVGFTGASFSDIAENELGFFVISSNKALGGFFLADITDTMNGDNNVDLSGLPSDPDEVVWVNSIYFSGWHLLTENSDWCYNSESNPSVGSFETDFITISSIWENEIGIDGGSLAEFVAGEYAGITVVMISTGDGQIMYWPAVPDGPFVSVPKPYTATISAWTSSATSAITYTVLTGTDGELGEKFTVTGSSVTGYNGTYYLGADGGVFTDNELSTPFDTTGLDPFTGTATISWSHGQYLDALHYNDGVFYAGNDNEEMFKSTNGGQSWTKVDQLGGGQGEDDGYLNDIDSYITNPGLITFNGVQIRGIATEGKFGLIKLVPNVSVEGYSFLDNGQFIQIYPTNLYDAPHIHIAAGMGAGGEGDLFLGDDDKYVQVNHNGGVSIQSYNTDTSNTYNWSFNTDGTVGFPYLETNLHNGGDQYGQTLKFGNAGQQVIITGPTPAADENAERIIIQGQKATGNGEGGDVYLWGGDAQYNGGDIKIYAGDADNTESGSGGYVNIDGGRGYTQGGVVEITGGQSPNGTGGNVNIRSGSGATSADNGIVTVQVGGYEWQFNNLGHLTLPSGGDIKNSSGVSVISGIKNVLTVSTTGNTALTLANDVVFCDTNAAGDTINIQFPETVPTGKCYTVKHINGVDAAYVQPLNVAHGIEWNGSINTGSYATLAVGECTTWIFDGASWRIISGF